MLKRILFFPFFLFYPSGFSFSYNRNHIINTMEYKSHERKKGLAGKPFIEGYLRYYEGSSTGELLMENGTGGRTLESGGC